MSDAKSSISEASSYHEIGEFWDSHDLGEFWEQTEPVEFDVEIDDSISYFPVEQSLADQLRQIAQAQGISAQTLLNIWVREKVEQGASEEMI